MTIEITVVLGGQSVTTTLDFNVLLHRRPGKFSAQRDPRYIPHVHDSKLLREITRALLGNEVILEVRSNDPYRLVVCHSPTVPWHAIVERVSMALHQHSIPHRFLGCRKDTLTRRLFHRLHRLLGR